ncbi:phosphohistidine phosphatase SixA [Chondromyces apiculatus]|uniref:phosphohistidine phosphatase SixA n=1 Tax=Chondromyces apiculatus TaxID=51 RepID=UPI0009DD9FE8|nr:phosphohistidine phosphatase SixA [Chondromyces apiculatus]
MEILIVRHGQAADDAPGLGDSGRWLTAKGRKTTRQVARWLAKRKSRRPAVIWTSPLVRAVQTAEILAEAAALTGDVSVASELSPGRDPADLLRLLSGYRDPDPLVLVGHEPMLSALVTSLVGEATWSGSAQSTDGEPQPKLRKSGVAALSWDGRGSATLRFVFDPKEMSLVGRVSEPSPSAPRKPKRKKGETKASAPSEARTTEAQD